MQKPSYLRKASAVLALLLLVSVPGLPAQASHNDPVDQEENDNEVRDIVFPVNGPNTFRDDFGEPRGGGTRTHEGVDIIAAKMTPLVSAVDGRVTMVVSPEASWGYAIYIKDEDDYSYRYLHLNNDTPGTDDGDGGEKYAYAPGIERGERVKAGELIGWVGDSGNAEEVGGHLHFEIHDEDGDPINPYESLRKATPPSPLEVGTPAPSYIFTKSMALGAQGEDVRQLQLRLIAEGVYTGPVTSYYGPLTEAGVRAFQVKYGIPQVGVVGPMTLAALNGSVSSPQATPTTPAPAPTTTPTQYSFVFGTNLYEGMSGEEVRQLQIRLTEEKVYSGPITGYFGPLTKAGVIAYQQAHGISPIGVVGPQTRAALNSSAVSE